MINCPKYRSEYNHVINTRSAPRWDAVRRRRVCDECEYRFTTYELRAEQIAKLAADLFEKDFAPAVKTALVHFSEKRY